MVKSSEQDDRAAFLCALSVSALSPTQVNAENAKNAEAAAENLRAKERESGGRPEWGRLVPIRVDGFARHGDGPSPPLCSSIKIYTSASLRRQLRGHGKARRCRDYNGRIQMFRKRTGLPWS